MNTQVIAQRSKSKKRRQNKRRPRRSCCPGKSKASQPREHHECNSEINGIKHTQLKQRIIAATSRKSRDQCQYREGKDIGDNCSTKGTGNSTFLEDAEAAYDGVYATTVCEPTIAPARIA